MHGLTTMGGALVFGFSIPPRSFYVVFKMPTIQSVPTQICSVAGCQYFFRIVFEEIFCVSSFCSFLLKVRTNVDRDSR